MEIVSILLRILGGVALFLYGMKVMSDGIQQSAGDRLQSALNFMTGNRFAGVITGFVVTGLIQSSSAVTVMVVTFVNAGLLTLTQSIGVIMGANIGTTVTAWVVSLVGFSLKLSEFTLPAIGIGFIWSMINWKYRNIGSIMMGFGFLFMGLDFMTKSMPQLGDTFDFIANYSDLGFLTRIIGMGAGVVVTLLVHSSSASTAITLTMAYNGMISYEMAACMILGANIGTTIDAALAAIGTKTAARRTALVHVLFNVLGTCWALPLLTPLLSIVSFVTPGTLSGAPFDPMIPTRLAMLHTVFNVTNTLVFLPFVKQFAALVTLIVKDKKTKEDTLRHYRFEYRSGAIHNTPELNILRAEKEIRDMASLTSDMYGKFCVALESMQEMPLTEEKTKSLTNALREDEAFADEMREAITIFLMECTRKRLNRRSEYRVSRLLNIVSNLEYITDECYILSLLLERSVVKNQTIKSKEITALMPYVGLVAEFLKFLGENLEGSISKEQRAWAKGMENRINDSRDKLGKLGRKRIEAGKDVRTELLFIDMVRRIEKLGDYCYSISETLVK